MKLSSPDVQKLIDSKYRVFVVATGAGAGVQKELWEHPGCSSFFVGSAFTYSNEETTGFLGFKPESFASPETALDMAMAAYDRALDMHGEKEAVGVACTASVASTREHRGDHRIHIAVMTKDRVIGCNTTIPKGVGVEARLTDGDTADALTVSCLLTATGVTPQNEKFFGDFSTEARAQFFRHPYFNARGERFAAPPDFGKRPPIIFPGAFNPPHPGHLGMANECLARVVFSITADLPHKDKLSLADMIRRARLLVGQEVLFSEGDSYYIDKARRHPKVGILVGADAALRMLDPKWGLPILPMLQEFKSLGTVFRVFGRVIDGKFTDVHEVRKQVPEEFHTLFSEMSGRWDVSSTELRKATPAAHAPT